MSIKTLSPNEYRQIIHLLETYQNNPVVNAVIEGTSPGQIFVDEVEFQKSAFVLTRAGFSLHRIDKKLLSAAGTNMQPWPSPEEFLKHGFGFWIMKGKDLVCECSTVFVGGGSVEINVHTNENYRERGLAAQVGTEFINHCQTHNLRPN